MTADDPNSISTHSGRSAARLAAVQALYQVDITGISPSVVVEEFVQHRFDAVLEGVAYDHVDASLFSDLVRGACARRTEIDGLVGGALTESWTVERLEKILRAILRLGAYELVARVDIPARVIITEYLDVANSFFDGAQPGLVNGVLDSLARSVRGDELAPGGSARAGAG